MPDTTEQPITAEQVNHLIEACEQAWSSLSDAEVDIRLAQREGDDDGIKAAHKNCDDIRADWHRLHVESRAKGRAFLVQSGLNENSITVLLRP